MRKPRNPPSDDLDEGELFSDHDFDLEVFIDTMEEHSVRRARQRQKRAAWQRVDDWRDAQWLRLQLQDWEDWD